MTNKNFTLNGRLTINRLLNQVPTIMSTDPRFDGVDVKDCPIVIVDDNQQMIPITNLMIGTTTNRETGEEIAVLGLNPAF